MPQASEFGFAGESRMVMSSSHIPLNVDVQASQCGFLQNLYGSLKLGGNGDSHGGFGFSKLERIYGMVGVGYVLMYVHLMIFTYLGRDIGCGRSDRRRCRRRCGWMRRDIGF